MTVNKLSQKLKLAGINNKTVDFTNETSTFTRKHQLLLTKIANLPQTANLKQKKIYTKITNSTTKN